MYNFNKNKTQLFQKNFKNQFQPQNVLPQWFKILYFFPRIKVWNNFCKNEEKEINTYLILSKTIKSKLIETEQELRYY